MDDDALDRLISAAAPILGIAVEQAWRASIRTHLDISLRHALAVAAFELPDEAEPLPIYRA